MNEEKYKIKFKAIKLFLNEVLCPIMICAVKIIKLFTSAAVDPISKAIEILHLCIKTLSIIFSFKNKDLENFLYYMTCGVMYLYIVIILFQILWGYKDRMFENDPACNKPKQRIEIIFPGYRMGCYIFGKEEKNE